MAVTPTSTQQVEAITIHSDMDVLRRRFVIASAAVLALATLLIALLLTLLPNAPVTLTIIGVNARVYIWATTVAAFVLLLAALRGNTRFAGYAMILLLVAVTYASTDTAGIALITLIIAAVIGSRRVFLGVLALIFVKIILEIGGIVSESTLSAVDLTRAVATRALMLVMGAMIRYVLEVTENSILRAERSAVLLRTSAEIGAVTTELSELQALFERTVNLIKDRFGFYHVQIFIINSNGDQAVLTVSTGDIGKRLLARHHQLAVGSQSVIGQVAMRGKSVIARDTDRDEVHFRNELLINTRSEIAVPIRNGVTVVGALDIQSVQPNAFDAVDVEALQLIADFLGTAIRNAGSFQEQSHIGEENRRLLQEAEENIRLIQRLNRELTRSSWEEFTRVQQVLAGVEMRDSKIVPLSEERGWSRAQKTATQEHRTVTEGDSKQNIVAVPLTLRGEVIGAIEVESGAENDPNTVSLIEEVAERLTISLENARLYEESRDATAQEQFINNLSARYQSVSTVEELLRVTLVELSETLGAKSGSIRLGKLELSGDQQPKNGVTAQ